MPNKHFKNLVEREKVIGEVVSVNDFLVKAKGLQPIRLNALVMFEDGSKGFVRSVAPDHVTILHMGKNPVGVGSGVVLQHEELVAKVGKDFIGRVINVRGEPLDGVDPIAPDAVWPVFHEAPPLIERRMLEDQLETGVTLVDTLFPIVLGQRIAVLGDSKSGKSTFLSQVTINQKNNDCLVVYVLIAKRKSDVDDLLAKLEREGARENAVVVVSTIFDSLVSSYLAPYVACSMAEYLWQHEERDVIIVYDDLTSHAQIHREISLLAGTSPGRDSYPGDMFYAHSSLLERAGRLDSSGKTLTSLPATLVPGGDISSFLPTNVMSITDGQLIFDLDLFRSGARPAISTGLSVSRVGGRGQSDRHKHLAARVLKKLASYYEATEFSHFGSELALEAKKDLDMGRRVLAVMNQDVGESHSLMAQQIMLETALSIDAEAKIDIEKLKEVADKHAPEVKDENTFKTAVQMTAQECTIEVKQ